MICDTAAQDRFIIPAGRFATLGARRLLLLAGLLLLLALAGWTLSQWLSGARSFSSQRVRIAVVTRGDLVRDISAEGRVIAANSPTLYAIAGGTVALKVVAGDVVRQGQELAVIDSPELRSRLVQEESTYASLEAQARRADLDARIATLNARKVLDQAEIDHTTATRQRERYRRAYDDHRAVSENDLNRAEDELQKAQIGLRTAQQDFELQSSGAQLDARNKQLLAQRQQAVVLEVRRQVEALTLRAPFDGQVGQVQMPQGTSVAANGPVLSVVDLARFEVEIRVPESFARELGIGMAAQLTSGASAAWPAEIAAVSPEVVNGEVTARLRFTREQPPGLRQNQRLAARVLMDARRDVLKVERGPFVDEFGGRTAYVMDGSSAVRRPVRLGASSLAEIEVREGLQVGDRIIVSGSDQFGNAEKVQIH
jgi:HlyD family secretion protein